jgi:ATP-dependent protease HslVU (ClpYQ) peptidase subunit
MSIIVSVKINDGVVMAADGATTFAVGQIYENANKIVNLVKGLPIGVMTCGSGGVGNASIATLLKDLRQRLSGEDEAHMDWKLDLRTYTMEQVTRRANMRSR